MDPACNRADGRWDCLEYSKSPSNIVVLCNQIAGRLAKQRNSKNRRCTLGMTAAMQCQKDDAVASFPWQGKEGTRKKGKGRKGKGKEGRGKEGKGSTAHCSIEAVCRPWASVQSAGLCVMKVGALRRHWGGGACACVAPGVGGAQAKGSTEWSSCAACAKTEGSDGQGASTA
eukprot:1159134-Pelagomonas_calceolata.AAC.15